MIGLRTVSTSVKSRLTAHARHALPFFFISLTACSLRGQVPGPAALPPAIRAKAVLEYNQANDAQTADVNKAEQELKQLKDAIADPKMDLEKLKAQLGGLETEVKNKQSALDDAKKKCAEARKKSKEKGDLVGKAKEAAKRAQAEADFKIAKKEVESHNNAVGQAEEALVKATGALADLDNRIKTTPEQIQKLKDKQKEAQSRLTQLKGKAVVVFCNGIQAKDSEPIARLRTFVKKGASLPREDLDPMSEIVIALHDPGDALIAAGLVEELSKSIPAGETEKREMLDDLVRIARRNSITAGRSDADVDVWIFYQLPANSTLKLEPEPGARIYYRTDATQNKFTSIDVANPGTYTIGNGAPDFKPGDSVVVQTKAPVTISQAFLVKPSEIKHWLLEKSSLLQFVCAKASVGSAVTVSQGTILSAYRDADAKVKIQAEKIAAGQHAAQAILPWARAGVTVVGAVLGSRMHPAAVSSLLFPMLSAVTQDTDRSSNSQHSASTQARANQGGQSSLSRIVVITLLRPPTSVVGKTLDLWDHTMTQLQERATPETRANCAMFLATTSYTAWSAHGKADDDLKRAEYFLQVGLNQASLVAASSNPLPFQQRVLKDAFDRLNTLRKDLLDQEVEPVIGARVGDGGRGRMSAANWTGATEKIWAYKRQLTTCCGPCGELIEGYSWTPIEVVIPVIAQGQTPTRASLPEGAPAEGPPAPGAPTTGPPLGASAPSAAPTPTAAPAPPPATPEEERLQELQRLAPVPAPAPPPAAPPSAKADDSPATSLTAKGIEKFAKFTLNEVKAGAKPESQVILMSAATNPMNLKYTLHWDDADRNTVDSRQYTIKPGGLQRLPNDRTWRVELEPGSQAIEIGRPLQNVIYTFMHKSGIWTLERSEP
jgi:hypothetical protein